MLKKAFHNSILFRVTWPLLFGALIFLLILLLNNNLNQLGTSFFSQELFFTISITYMVFEINRYVIIVSGKLSSVGITLLINILATALVVATALGEMVRTNAKGTAPRPVASAVMSPYAKTVRVAALKIMIPGPRAAPRCPW